MKYKTLLSLILVGAFLLSGVVIYAQDHDEHAEPPTHKTQNDQQTEHAEQTEHSDHSEHAKHPENAEHVENNAEHSEHDAHEEHGHAHKHHLALFNGATTNFDHKSTGYTIGLDYEFRLSKMIGIGVVGEYIAMNSGEIIGGIVFFAHPFAGSKILVAPLVLFAEEHEVTEGAEHAVDTEEAAKKEAHFPIRLGTAYDFHLGKLTLSPTLNFDIGKTIAAAYGLSVGFGF